MIDLRFVEREIIEYEVKDNLHKKRIVRILQWRQKEQDESIFGDIFGAHRSAKWSSWSDVPVVKEISDG